MDDISGYLGSDQRTNKDFWDRVRAMQATLPHDAATYSQTDFYQPRPVAASINAMRDWLMPHILPYLMNYGFYQMQEPKQLFGADIVPANEFAKITPRR